MNSTNYIKILLFTLVCIVAISCTYEKVDEDLGLPENMSFKNDIMPMFDTHCNSAGCHNNGGIAPDLSPANAYKVITTTPGMIDLAAPENSELYVRMVDVAKPMPMSGVLSYESSQVLSWITDGAKDN